MQGQSPQQIYAHIREVLWDMQKAQWAFWIPIQLLNFKFVPVRHQLNVVLLTSVVWTALLSMWYPPVKKIEEEANVHIAPEWRACSCCLRWLIVSSHEAEQVVRTCLHSDRWSACIRQSKCELTGIWWSLVSCCSRWMSLYLISPTLRRCLMVLKYKQHIRNPYTRQLATTSATVSLVVAPTPSPRDSFLSSLGVGLLSRITFSITQGTTASWSVQDMTLSGCQPSTPTQEALDGSGSPGSTSG